MTKDAEETGSVIVAFRAPRELAERAEQAAAREGITRSDVARRALLRDLAAAAAPSTRAPPELA